MTLWSDAGLPHKPHGRDSRAYMSKEMENPDVAYFGLFADEKMLGLSIASFDGRRGWINRLAVDPDVRGIGLAADLLEVCELFLKDRGALVMAALIEDVNAPSMACFEKNGYTSIPEIKYFSKRESWDV
jgi:GNAT superfamily N-acetyltransferase